MISERGALVGWTALKGDISLVHVLPLYFSGICWTLVYDTLYGYQDVEDDAKLGKNYYILSSAFDLLIVNYLKG